MPLTRNEWHKIELNTELDKLYLNCDKKALKECLKAFKKNGGLDGYRLASAKSVDKIIDEVKGLKPGQISPSLFESYSEDLRKAVDNVFNDDSELSDRLKANVSKFAAYKAYKATDDIMVELSLGDEESAKINVKKYNRYQAAEYNTTISRCRTAKQFEQFNDPDNVRLFPNLRWLPSRSVDPREEHMLFYNRVWSKDDPFWDENTPGSLWNCKCDWEETDDRVTNGNPNITKSVQGLKGNPAITGDVFSSDHPYFSEIVNEKTLSGLIRNYTKNIFNELRGHEIDITLPNVGTVSVLVDRKTRDHICNDASEFKDFTIPQIVNNITMYAKKSKCVATAPNEKTDKKRWAIRYYYMEFSVGSKKYYFDIEEVNNTAEGRHFFRFYSISNHISEFAVM